MDTRKVIITILTDSQNLYKDLCSCVEEYKEKIFKECKEKEFSTDQFRYYINSRLFEVVDDEGNKKYCTNAFAISQYTNREYPKLNSLRNLISDIKDYNNKYIKLQKSFDDEKIKEYLEERDIKYSFTPFDIFNNTKVFDEEERICYGIGLNYVPVNYMTTQEVIDLLEKENKKTTKKKKTITKTITIEVEDSEGEIVE